MLKKYAKDYTNYPHVASSLELGCKIIENTTNYFIIHNERADMYIIECENNYIQKIIEIIEVLKPKRIQTTCKKLYDFLKDSYRKHYSCYNFIYNDVSKAEPILKLEKINKKDLSVLEETYEDNEYINKAYTKGKIYGYYEKNDLIGYIGEHIDGTIGMLYVKPDYRNKHLGRKIAQSGFFINNKKIQYVQVLTNNSASIKVYKKIGCITSKPKIYWLYNEDYVWN